MKTFFKGPFAKNLQRGTFLITLSQGVFKYAMTLLEHYGISAVGIFK
jgi:hypothetical protein